MASWPAWLAKIPGEISAERNNDRENGVAKAGRRNDMKRKFMWLLKES
jgi:hypothetical protein